MSAVAPVAWVDEVARTAGVSEASVLRIHLSASEIRCAVARGEDIVAAPLTDDYPDYRRLLDDRDVGRGVDATALASVIRRAETADEAARGAAEGRTCDDGGSAEGGSRRHTDAQGAPLVILTATDDRLSILAEEGGASVAVAREFLLDALDSAGDRPTLRLDGPISPLVIRRNDETFSLLMPARIA